MSARANSSKSYSSKNNKENTIDGVPWCSAPRHSDPILATPARVFWMKASPHHCQWVLWPGTGRLHTLSSRGGGTTCRALRRENTGWQGACITHTDRGLVGWLVDAYLPGPLKLRQEKSRRKLACWLRSAVRNNLACDLSSPLAPREKSFMF